jgi:lipopolysaccharide transport protein LptA
MPGFALRASVIVSTLGLLAGPAHAQDDSASESQTINCDSLSGNARSEEYECVGLRIDDGTHVVSAGRASTNRYDLDGSVWQLDDTVRLSFGSTEIQAESARFEFDAGELVSAALRGTPVTMSDYIEEADKAVSGTAETIVYDRRKGTLSLTGQATLVVGANEKTLSGCAWVYNLNDKTFNAGSDENCAGVQLRLTLPEEDDSPDGQPAPP